MFMVNDPDYIDPAFAIPATIILWLLFGIIVLVQLRRSKIKRDAVRRVKRDLKRRETFIQLADEYDPIPDFVKRNPSEDYSDR
jgi:hypothetical protein